jgi:Tol biopolymer transport system component
VRTSLIILSACVSSILINGCSVKPKPDTPSISSSAEPIPNTTDIISVDQKAGTFVALVRRDHTTDHILAKCGIRCPSEGKNFAGFWSLPASQVGWVVIKQTESEGLHTQ